MMTSRIRKRLSMTRRQARAAPLSHPVRGGPSNVDRVTASIGQDLATITVCAIIAVVARRYDFTKVGRGELLLDEDRKPVLNAKGQEKAKSELYIVSIFPGLRNYRFLRSTRCSFANLRNRHSKLLPGQLMRCGCGWRLLRRLAVRSRIAGPAGTEL